MRLGLQDGARDPERGPGQGARGVGDAWGAEAGIPEVCVGRLAVAGGHRCQQKGLGSRSARWARHSREGPKSMAGAAQRFCKLGFQGRPGLHRETWTAGPDLAFLLNHLPTSGWHSAAAAGREAGPGSGLELTPSRSLRAPHARCWASLSLGVCAETQGLSET